MPRQPPRNKPTTRKGGPDDWDAARLHLDAQGVPYAKPLRPKQWCAENGVSAQELCERLADLEVMGLVVSVRDNEGRLRYYPKLDTVTAIIASLEGADPKIVADLNVKNGRPR